MIRTIALALALCVSLDSGAVIAAAMSQAASGVASSFVGTVTGGRSDRTDRTRNLEAERARAVPVKRDLDAERARPADFTGKLRAVSTDRDTLRKKMSPDVVVYHGEKKRGQEVVADASRRTSSRFAGSAFRDVASAAGEAQPFVGVGVIAATTAYELCDARETMNEMHQLDVSFNPGRAIAGRGVCGMRTPTSAELWESVTYTPALIWGEGNTSPVPGVSGKLGWSYQTMPAKLDWMREELGTPSRDGPP